MNNEIKIAVLIDSDNIPAKYINHLMAEITKHGTPTVKRIYGDWTKPHIAKWKPELLSHAIAPVQQYSYTNGKNATDSAMIIDAMDILYSDKVDGFCLVSSDSDFTRLATRLREAGKKVFGMGEKKTPNPFIVACDIFIYLEILENKEEKNLINGKVKKTKVDKITPKLLNLLSTTVSDVADDDGWAFLGDVGSLLVKKQADFDPRNYGFFKLTPLFNSITQFEIDQRVKNSGKEKLIYVKNK